MPDGQMLMIDFMRKVLFLITTIILLQIPGLDAQVINTIAGRGTYGSSGDGGAATAAQVLYLWHVTTDAAGNVYFTDNADARVRKIDAAGIITTITGNGVSAFSGEGVPATAARFMAPSGITNDGAGNIYIADNLNHRIRKIDNAGIITTIAGNGTAGSVGDGGPATAARLNAPYGIILDGAGNLYIADAGNNKVRKIDAAGMMSTVAGTGTAGFSGDGLAATSANLSAPSSVAVDQYGNLYIGDAVNNRIRKVNNAGIIGTMAGTGTAGFAGDGGAASAAFLNRPLGIATDRIGNLFISDQYNHRIRKVSVGGTITTIAGTGTAAYSGDGAAATLAEVNQTFGIIVDDTGNIFFSDWGNFRLRKISNGNRLPSFVSGVLDSFAICENAAAMDISSLLRVTDADAAQLETWTLITPPLHGTAAIYDTVRSTSATMTPTGLTYTPATGYSGRDSFVVRVDDGYSIDTIMIYVRVKPLPDAGVISGSSLLCIGIPIPLTETVSGGVWSSTNTGLAMVSSTGTVDGVSYGIDTILYTVTTEGCASVASHVLSVYTIVDSVAGPGAVCFGLSELLTGIPPGGTWSSTNGVTSVTSGGLVTGITPGVDTIIYTVTNPCSVSTFLKPVRVSALAAPTLYIEAFPSAFIVPGTSDTLVAIITSGSSIVYSYQWQLNGTDIPGATDSTYISSTFNNGDSVTCNVFNGPCSASSFSWIYIVYVSDDVTDMDLAKIDVALLPNPNRGTFRIKGILPAGAGDAVIQITDLVGKLVYKETAQANNGKLNKDVNLGRDLADGMYLLHIMTNAGQKVVKFTITQ